MFLQVWDPTSFVFVELNPDAIETDFVLVN